MKCCGVCGAEYVGTASKDGASHRVVHKDTVEYMYECYLCLNNTDRRLYPRTRPGTKREVSDKHPGSVR